MRDAQALAGATKLILSNGGHLTRIMSVLAGLDATGSVTESAIRTRDDNRLYPLHGIERQDATGRGGLVVGMSVDGHQRQLWHRFGGHYWSIAPKRRSEQIAFRGC